MVLLLQFAEWLGGVERPLSTAVGAVQLPGTKWEVREVVGVRELPLSTVGGTCQLAGSPKEIGFLEGGWCRATFFRGLVGAFQLPWHSRRGYSWGMWCSCRGPWLWGHSSCQIERDRLERRQELQISLSPRLRGSCAYLEQQERLERCGVFPSSLCPRWLARRDAVGEHVSFESWCVVGSSGEVVGLCAEHERWASCSVVQSSPVVHDGVEGGGDGETTGGGRYAGCGGAPPFHDSGILSCGCEEENLLEKRLELRSSLCPCLGVP